MMLTGDKKTLMLRGDKNIIFIRTAWRFPYVSQSKSYVVLGS
jgi:hypothetical protein